MCRVCKHIPTAAAVFQGKTPQLLDFGHVWSLRGDVHAEASRMVQFPWDWCHARGAGRGWSSAAAPGMGAGIGAAGAVGMSGMAPWVGTVPCPQGRVLLPADALAGLLSPWQPGRASQRAQSHPGKVGY